jgi:hypothetical protein
MDYKTTIRHIKETRDTERMPDTSGYNENVRKSWIPIWSRNAARSYEEVERRFARQDCDMRNIPRLDGSPVLVLGSGPSLDDILPYLKGWKGKITCSTSHLPILKYMGIEPDFCFLIDADPTMEYLVGDYAGMGTKTIMITHPQIPREVIAAWPCDKVYFFRMYDPGDKFSTEFMPLIYGWVNQEKGWHIGSYILNSGNVVNAMVPAMQALGAGTIFLCGYDLGYPDLPDQPGVPRQRSSYFGKMPVAYSKPGEENVLHIAPGMPTQEERPIKYEKSNNGILCDELCFFYKYSFIILYGLGNVPVLSCSRGIISEVPYIDPKEVMEKQGRGFEHLIRKAAESYRIAQEYLRCRGIYILKTDFHVETINLATLKWLKRIRFLANWHWLRNRPWKWMGGKGYVPRKFKKLLKAQAAAGVKQ